jgi:citrate synthase
MDKRIASELCSSTATSIHVRGHDLCGELIGRLDLGGMAWLELTGRLPRPDEARLFNGMLITLVEHGLTPMALASRLTYMGAPESLQAAVAAGLCGMGTAFAGTTEGSARMLSAALRDAPPAADLQALAGQVVDRMAAEKRPIPGIGHPLHKPVDPRTTALFALAHECGFHGRHVALMEAVAAIASERSGKNLPVNATGAIGALSCELSLDWRVCRGLAVMGRAVGLVGHINEEIQRPLARAVWETVEHISASNLGEH